MTRSQCLGLMRGDLVKITKIWEGNESDVIVGVILNHDEGENRDPFGRWETPYSALRLLLCEGVVKEIFVEEEDEIKLISPTMVLCKH